MAEANMYLNTKISNNQGLVSNISLITISIPLQCIMYGCRL